MSATASASAIPLEQQRAADAWRKALAANQEYARLAKGLPALVMNSGLLQVLAFLHEKGSKQSQKHCGLLGDDLRAWLHQRFSKQLKLSSADFQPFMEALMDASPQLFQQVTMEAMAWLRWSRQMAAAAHVATEE